MAVTTGAACSGLQQALLELGTPDTDIITSSCISESALLVKSLVWRVSATQQPLVFVLRQADKINYKQVEKLAGGKVVLATKADAMSLSGYRIGNIPPYGHKITMPVFVDKQILPANWETETSHKSVTVSEEEEEKGGDRMIKTKADPLIFMGSGIQDAAVDVGTYTDIDKGGISLTLSRLLQLPGVTVASLTLPLPPPSHQSPPSIAPSPSTPCPSTETLASKLLSQLQLSGTTSALESPSTVTSTAITSFQKLVMRCKSREETPDLFFSLAQCLRTGSGVPLATGCNAAGKNALHLAAWRGSEDVVDLLLPFVHIDEISTGCGNYGKSPLFYAITRNRDSMVQHLLAKGASVLLVNNKGQTPYSLGVSHLQPPTLRIIEQKERDQLLSGGGCRAGDGGKVTTGWLDYYASHCDGREYGDLDPRFVQNNRCVSSFHPLRVMLIPCCTDTYSDPVFEKERQVHDTMHTTASGRSEHSNRHHVNNRQRHSRLHQLVYIYQSKITVIDTIRLTKSLQITTIESRAERVTRMREKTQDPVILSVKEEMEATQASYVPKNSKQKGPVALHRDTITTFSGIITGVQAAHEGLLLARLSSAESRQDTTTGTSNGTDLHRKSNKHATKSKSAGFFFLSVGATSPNGTPIPASTAAATSRAHEEGSTTCIAVVVYLKFSALCLRKATFSASWQGPPPSDGTDIHDLIGCEVVVKGHCEPKSLRTHYQLKSAAHKGKKKLPIWRFDVAVDTLVYVQRVTKYSKPHKVLPGETFSKRKLSALPIIAVPDALFWKDIQSFHHKVLLPMPTTQTETSLIISTDSVLCMDDIHSFRSTGMSSTIQQTVSLVVVDTLEGIFSLKEAVGFSDSAATPHKQIIGIDCEWKADNTQTNACGNSSKGPNKIQNCVSILQLSTRTQAFIIDLQELLWAKVPSNAKTKADVLKLERELNAVLLQLFSNPLVLIIGWGVKQDLETLADSYPHMSCFDFRAIALASNNRSCANCDVACLNSMCDERTTSRRWNVLDLQPCMKSLNSNNTDMNHTGTQSWYLSPTTSTSANSQTKGGRVYSLALACDVILHKKLSKDMQLSDWTVRPLSKEQQAYAAMDAMVLCLLFDILCSSLCTP